MKQKCPFCGTPNTMKSRRGWICMSQACWKRFNENDIKVRNTLTKRKIQALISSGNTLQQIAEHYDTDIKLIRKLNR